MERMRSWPPSCMSEATRTGTGYQTVYSAQFMREWSSGTQTDFTNYAARRLAERGLLREEDPIKLQRAVTEIAYSYARGGSSATGYVPSDSPLIPSRPLPEAMGWPDSSLREQYDANRRAADGTALGQQTSASESEIRARQARQRAAPGQVVGNDLAGRVGASEAETKAKIDKGPGGGAEFRGNLPGGGECRGGRNEDEHRGEYHRLPQPIARDRVTHGSTFLWVAHAGIFGANVLPLELSGRYVVMNGRVCHPSPSKRRAKPAWVSHTTGAARGRYILGDLSRACRMHNESPLIQ